MGFASHVCQGALATLLAHGSTSLDARFGARCAQHVGGTCATLFYAILVPGRKSAFRAGFWPDCYRESTEIGPPASLRPAFGRPEGRFRCFPGCSPAKIRPGSPTYGLEVLQFFCSTASAGQHKKKKELPLANRSSSGPVVSLASPDAAVFTLSGRRR